MPLRAHMPPALIVILLSLLLGLQPVTTDLYLPALPAIAEGFGTGTGPAQMTLAAMLLAFGAAQMVWGPLSDRFGRRPVLLWGLAAYVLASVGSVLAPSMDWLIAWRAMQGGAMAAGVMCARAIVRDLYPPVEGARAMSKSMTGLGVIACGSGPLGGMLQQAFGWRAALLPLALFGAATLAMVAWRFQETLAPRNRRALHPVALARNWIAIGRHPTFLAYAALTTTSFLGLFSFLATSSFVFIRLLGFSTTQFGFAMFGMSMSYIAGTFLCRWLLLRTGVRRTVAVGGGLSLAGGTLMGLLAQFGWGQPWYGAWAILAPLVLLAIGHGIHQPCGQSGAVGPFPQSAGAASALNGLIMMSAAFLMGGWLGTRMDGTVFPMVHSVWFCSAGIALAAWTLVRKHGEHGPH